MTKETILKIYRGDLICCNLPGVKCPKYDEAMVNMIKCQNQMEKRIPEELKKDFFAMCEMHSLVDTASLEEMFVEGFITGMRLAVEALYEDKAA